MKDNKPYCVILFKRLGPGNVKVITWAEPQNAEQLGDCLEDLIKHGKWIKKRSLTKSNVYIGQVMDWVEC